MRDHMKLRAFDLADELAVRVYEVTSTFPREERLGLGSQLRRAAVSVPSSIVEGSARSSEADYLRFLDVAYGSAKEVEYQLALARRLRLFDPTSSRQVETLAYETARTLNNLIRALRRPQYKQSA